mmetsp:Transcript_25941/g.41084  ORF Transcript_25941/g.41084 Transcript_25941/m.41084 type:complete len:227 (+) Transcript_25941:1776-2456(+)
MKWPGLLRTCNAPGHGQSGFKLWMLTRTVSSILAIAHVAAVATDSAAKTPAPTLRKSSTDLTDISSSEPCKASDVTFALSSGGLGSTSAAIRLPIGAMVGAGGSAGTLFASSNRGASESSCSMLWSLLRDLASRLASRLANASETEPVDCLRSNSRRTAALTWCALRSRASSPPSESSRPKRSTKRRARSLSTATCKEYRSTIPRQSCQRQCDLPQRHTSNTTGDY